MRDIVERVEAAGVSLSVEGDKLVLLGAVNKLTQKQMDYLKKHKPEIISELKSATDSMDAMRASQPTNWGWWGFLLQDGQQGSIRGPHPTREAAQTAIYAEFGQPAIKLVPLPGTLHSPSCLHYPTFCF